MSRLPLIGYRAARRVSYEVEPATDRHRCVKLAVSPPHYLGIFDVSKYRFDSRKTGLSIVAAPQRALSDGHFLKPVCAQPYGSRIRHEDEKIASAISMRIPQSPR